MYTSFLTDLWHATALFALICFQTWVANEHIGLFSRSFSWCIRLFSYMCGVPQLCSPWYVMSWHLQREQINRSLLQVSFLMKTVLMTNVWRAAALFALICHHICNANEYIGLFFRSLFWCIHLFWHMCGVLQLCSPWYVFTFATRTSK